VFGGYTSVGWSSCSCTPSDTAAYLFSLRRRSFNSTEVFSTSSSTSHIYDYPNFGPSFSSDIRIRDNSDIVGTSSTSCSRFQCPTGGSSHLAGDSSFFTTEIEVFQVN
jgi:hypothetical protein